MTTAAHESTPTIGALVARFFSDVLNRQNVAAGDEILAESFVVHHPAFREGTDGREIMGVFLAGFPDLHYDVEEIVVDGDRAVVHWRATGTHTGEFFQVAPTGRRVTVVGADVFHAASGRLTTTWVNSDLFGLFYQLGEFPSMAFLRQHFGAAPIAPA
jgi:predicted ester cyclase